MSNNMLDDISFDDIKKIYDIEHKGEHKTNSKKAVSAHIMQVFCELPKGKDVILFALVNFNGYERYDIRRWYDNGTKPGKGMSFTQTELKVLQEAIKDITFEDYGIRKTAMYGSGKIRATIYERLCLISSYKEKEFVWNKEATIVDWNYGLKVDLRKWSEGYEKCGKGISLSFDEILKIQKVLRGFNL